MREAKMDRIADLVKGYTGPNPFSDSQGRNFSDEKVSSEFFPISKFWSLFNNQHEVLLGTRGSGKTFLLKMMRHSMLKKIDDSNARRLVEKGDFFALYVPMHLEFVKSIPEDNVTESTQTTLFQIAFNSILAHSLIDEVRAKLSDEEDTFVRLEKSARLANLLYKIWFSKTESSIDSLSDLSIAISTFYYTLPKNNEGIALAPPVFRQAICTSLISVKEIVEEVLDLHSPTWIICVDEAEFLNETLQKCLNSVFRSDSNRIALKVATLPFFHTTLETTEPGIYVDPHNDFNYRVVDMDYDSIDFVQLTNKLCQSRLALLQPPPTSLEDFLGVIGNDNLIDYYREEVGEDRSRREYIEEDMITMFGEVRRRGSSNYSDRRKTLYDKFAPIYYTRKMYAISKSGNSVPGWFAGTSTVRKVAQGNPRVFIQLMNNLFEAARETALTPKAQHRVVMEFSENICDATQSLEKRGPNVKKYLNRIATQLKNKVHSGDLISVGSSFTIKYKDDASFDYYKEEWLHCAIAYLRLTIDDASKINGLKKDTVYTLANTYAVAYWLPLRKDIKRRIDVDEDSSIIVTDENIALSDPDQLSLFEEVPNAKAL